MSSSTKNRGQQIFDGFMEHEPFYFKSYDRIIGTCTSIHQLWIQFEKLGREDPDALEYHLKEGHIVKWLEYSNEKELASELTGVADVQIARAKVSAYLQRRHRRIGNKPEHSAK